MQNIEFIFNEKHLIPTLKITAYVDGREVTAEIKNLRGIPDRTTDPWKLKKGEMYAFELSYEENGTLYTGKIEAFTCSDYGLIQKPVRLKKIEFNGTVMLPGGVELKLIRIPKGGFLMGSPDGSRGEKELGRDSDEGQHLVTLSHDFYLGETEITQGQWKAIMRGKLAKQDKKDLTNPSYFQSDDRPVEQVSWNDAMQFCEELNKRFSQQLNGKWKFTLPTEAQWEYACRGGTMTALNNGTNLTSTTGRCSNLDKVGWYYGNSGKETHAVRRLAANKFGLYDMHGNVWEWCLDSCNWDSGVVTDTYSGEQKDPVCSTGSARVLRGGGWSSRAQCCRSARRSGNDPTIRDNGVGFRVALVPVQ